MKMSLLTAVLLALSACDTGAKPPPVSDAPRTIFDGVVALGYVETQLGFGPRIPGSDGARRAGDWILEQMRARSDTVIVQEWTHTTVSGQRLPMRNFLARIRPGDATRVLYVAHWDTRPFSDDAESSADRKLPVPGANDGASGVALLIALADALKKTPPTVGVDLLLVDGEDYGDFAKLQDVLIGSTWFADHLPAPDYRPIFGVVWDMIGDRDLNIKHEGWSVQQAPEVVSRVWQKAAALGYSAYFTPQSQGNVTDDHVPLLKKGLRVIDVIDIDFGDHHKPTDTLDKVSARSLQIVGDVALSLLTEP